MRLPHAWFLTSGDQCMGRCDGEKEDCTMGVVKGLQRVGPASSRLGLKRGERVVRECWQIARIAIDSQ